MKNKVLPLVFSLAACWSSPTWAASSSAQLCSLNLRSDPALAFFQASSRPSFQPGPCSVSRECEFPPPASVSCSGSTGCSSGASVVHGLQGWVQCDNGPYLACSPPPPPQCAIASCTTTSECLDGCSIGMVPTAYECVDDCCICTYE